MIETLGLAAAWGGGKQAVWIICGASHLRGRLTWGFLVRGSASCSEPVEENLWVPPELEWRRQPHLWLPLGIFPGESNFVSAFLRSLAEFAIPIEIGFVTASARYLLSSANLLCHKYRRISDLNPRSSIL